MAGSFPRAPVASGQALRRLLLPSQDHPSTLIQASFPLPSAASLHAQGSRAPYSTSHPIKQLLARFYPLHCSLSPENTMPFPARRFIPWQREFRAGCQDKHTEQWFSIPSAFASPRALSRGKHQKQESKRSKSPGSHTTNHFPSQYRGSAGTALPKLRSTKGFLSASSRGWNANKNISSQ